MAENQIGAHLAKFIGAECANYDRHYRVCLTDEPCMVLAGEPCSYFERAVLGPPDYPYKLPQYDYRKLFEQYGQIQTRLSGCGVTVRKCDCGATLKPRERVCEKCQRRKNRETRRQRRQNRQYDG